MRRCEAYEQRAPQKVKGWRAKALIKEKPAVAARLRCRHLIAAAAPARARPVGGSELAFRLLVATAPNLPHAVIKSEELTKRLRSCIARGTSTTPLVAHFSGNDAATLLTVAKRAERCPGIVAIDLNLGCPQRSAHSGHFGAFLCEPHDRPLLLSIVATCAKGLGIPFFCKIRLLDDLNETLEFASQLEAAGCALLCVHARYRGSPMHRRDGPAHLDQVKLIMERLNIPVLANGNVRNASELLEKLNTTGADGIMTAEARSMIPLSFAERWKRAQ